MKYCGEMKISREHIEAIPECDFLFERPIGMVVFFLCALF